MSEKLSYCLKIAKILDTPVADLGTKKGGMGVFPGAEEFFEYKDCFDAFHIYPMFL